MSEAEKRYASEIIGYPFHDFNTSDINEFLLMLETDALPKDEQSLLAGKRDYWIKIGVRALIDNQHRQLSQAESKVISAITFNFQGCLVTHYFIDKKTVLTPTGRGSLFTFEWDTQGGRCGIGGCLSELYKGSSITTQAAAFRWIAENAPQHCGADGINRSDLKNLLHQFAAHGSKLCTQGGVVNGNSNSDLSNHDLDFAINPPGTPSEIKLCQQLFVNVGGRKSILSQAMTGL